MYSESETNWFSTAILQSIDGFIDWSVLSGHVNLSASFKNILGYSRTELLNTTKDFFTQISHPDDSEKIEEYNKNFFHSLKSLYEIECRFRTKEDNYLWVRLQGHALRDDLGTCHRIALVVINMHEYKSHLNKVEKISEAKSKFIASLNHELRAPLASIMGIAHLILEDEGEIEKEQHTQYMHHIISSADMLMALVNDILDVSKIDAGKMTLEKTVLDFGEVLEQVHDIVRAQYEKKGLFFCIQHDPRAPHYVLSDSTRLKQVLINLCTNAIKFTEHGGIYINTKFTPITTTTCKMYCEVVDTGIGITEDKIDLLFRDFIQADVSTTRQYGGTGLGLSICKKIIELMGGSIACSSQANVGSVFWFELILELPSEKVHPSRNNLANTSKITPSKSTPHVQHLIPFEEQGKSMTSTTFSLNILVAEDNMVNQAVIRGLLEKLGHHITLAEDGVQAVEQHAKNGPFDIILMDINMPNMTGIDACLKIRATDQKIPIVAITANTLDTEKQKCLSAGMNAFATKPVNKEKLFQILREFCGGPATVLEEQPTAKAPVSEIIYVHEESMHQMIADLGKDKIKQFVELYKKDAPRLIQNILSKKEIENSAHTLAGMSENLNFIALGKSSRVILNITKHYPASTQTPPTLEKIIQQLPPLYANTIKITERILK